MLIEGSKWTLLENPFDSTKSKKRKSEKALIVYRWVFQRKSAWCWEGFKSSPLIFQATHQTHKNSTKQNRHFPMSISYKSPQEYVQTAVCRLDGEDVKSLPLAFSTRDLTCTLKRACFWALWRGLKLTWKNVDFLSMKWLPSGVPDGCIEKWSLSCSKITISAPHRLSLMNDNRLAFFRFFVFVESKAFGKTSFGAFDPHQLT